MPTFDDKIKEFKANCDPGPGISTWAIASDPSYSNSAFKTPKERTPYLKSLLVNFIFEYIKRTGLLPNGITVSGLANAGDLCTVSVCDASKLPSEPSNGGSTPGAGTTTPACTKADGSTSGNPYDCSPQDNEFKCSIIDVPCALRKAFVPDKDFIKNKLENSSFGINVNLPVTVVQSWSVDIDVLGTKMPIKLDFSGLTLSEKTKDQFRFMIFWGTFLWLLHFLGVPFLGSRQSAGEAARDSFNRVTAEAEHREQEAEAKYRALRADDSWKQP